ncbi:hypothetical protein DICPUDRAFT_97634 [Dictyostelium purpureum]|uniref:Uncharacterized protein n=1 Tax=Dictyostelium purpureum TaxID=5786 RepID=F0ZIF1_DICPU|nr:uncharacterized protein DICPUDRAFT_97634 [Dictyostelium purpureum]EGC36248.1 hypothetical protein DICPUDRAFT_97634 [Dictyostelium purpureum]|eukprot:XP_003287194.1 hypothetical protein DICPUDRAFT_97634 [Dictyostelium purpureum]
MIQNNIFYDPLSLDYRSADTNYSFLLYLLYKIGNLFHIYVNGEKVRVVSEDYSLYSSISGTLQFIIVDPTKKRKRKISNGFWKQNGDENIVAVKLPNNLKCTKKNFTKIEYTNEDKSFKCWEYSMFEEKEEKEENKENKENNKENKENEKKKQKKCILRHYLKDVSAQVKYFTQDIHITIRSKNRYFSTNEYLVSVDDHQM